MSATPPAVSDEQIESMRLRANDCNYRIQRDRAMYIDDVSGIKAHHDRDALLQAIAERNAAIQSLKDTGQRVDDQLIKVTAERDQALRQRDENKRMAESLLGVIEAEYRGMPDLRCGHRVEVHGSSGTVVGHNSAANFEVLFDSGRYSGQTLSVHPSELSLISNSDRAG